MNTTLSQIIRAAVILPLIMGIFAFPTTSKADWTDILGNIGVGGIGGNSNSGGLFGWGSGSNGIYDTNSTSGQNNGDIRLSKRVRRVDQDQNYRETIVVRSGSLVEVWLEVKNTSNRTAAVIVSDTLGGSVVYKKDSLRLNGQTSQSGLTSGGISINMSPKTTSIITYQIYVCGGSDYAIRANAYAAEIGSATDAVIIETEDSRFVNSYNNDVYTCMNQFQSLSTTSTAGNALSGWTGVNNSNSVNNTVNNPFGDWTGVNNSSATTSAANNPFSGWTGVNNANTVNSTVNNPFGDWTGVNNSTTASTTNNPFSGWTGVSNSNTANYTTSSNNAFGDWYGVSSTTQNNPFGDWTGVNNNSGYDMRGYSNNQVASADTSNTGISRASVASTTTNFVAPTTGVNKFAPVWFAGILTLGFLIIRKRKLLFS